MQDAKVAESSGLGSSPPVRFTVWPVGDKVDDDGTACSADAPTPRAGETFPSGARFSPPTTRRRPLVSQLSRTSESNRSNRSVRSNFSDFTCPSEDGVGILSLANDINSILGSSILLSNPSYAGVCDAATESLSLGSGPHTAAGQGGGNEHSSNGKVAISGGGAMVDLIENPEYIDTLEGRLSLAEAAKMIARDSLVAAVGFGMVTPESVKRECYSKLLAISFCFMFLYSAFFACRNLQSSMTADESLGLQTLAALYALSWLGAACGYPLMLLMRPCWAILSSMLPCLLYVAANFYQAPYTLLPAALLQSVALGIMWAAEGVYMVNIAAVYSVTFDEPYYIVVARFNAIFYTIYQGSCVVGNVVTSILLDHVGANLTVHHGRGLLEAPLFSNGTLSLPPAVMLTAVGQVCGASYAFGSGNSSVAVLGSLLTIVDEKKHYVVLAVLGAFVACGVLTASVFLRSRRGDGARLEAVTASHLPLLKAGAVGAAFRRSLKQTGRALIDAHMLLLAPYILYLGFSGSLIYGDFSKAFISCRYGIGMVGYVYLVGAVLGVAGSFLSGIVSRRIGRRITVCGAAAVSASCLLALLLWRPEVQMTFVAFLPTSLWFFSDAVTSSLINALLGVLFKERLPAACAAFLLFFGVGVALGALSTAHAWLAITDKVYVAAAMLVAGLASYLTLELLMKRRRL